MDFIGIEKNSLIEWPGKIVAVAYTRGCNFRCPFCQNRDLVLHPQNLSSFSEEKVLEHLDNREKWLDGAVVTGGEPMIHEELPEFAAKVKNRGFGFGVETNGTRPEMIEELLEEGLVDYIAMDIKAPLEWEKYRKAAGIEDKNLLRKIKKSIEILKNSNTEHEYRTTVVPTILDENDIFEIAQYIEGERNYYLQQFVPENTLDKSYENVNPYSDEKMKEIGKKINENFGFKNCKVRNI
ncbi:MAG: anaerobic ribonucleoside-triphosphate reductase activating protein [Candidatus Hadarchaeia archaeon]